MDTTPPFWAFAMLLRLLLLFVTVPLVELYLLLELASITGPGATFLLVIITGIIGSWLAKREGLIAWQKFHAALGRWSECPVERSKTG